MQITLFVLKVNKINSTDNYVRAKHRDTSQFYVIRLAIPKKQIILVVDVTFRNISKYLLDSLVNSY